MGGMACCRCPECAVAHLLCRLPPSSMLHPLLLFQITSPSCAVPSRPWRLCRHTLLLACWLVCSASCWWRQRFGCSPWSCGCQSHSIEGVAQRCEPDLLCSSACIGRALGLPNWRQQRLRLRGLARTPYSTFPPHLPSSGARTLAVWRACSTSLCGSALLALAACFLQTSGRGSCRHR